MSHHTASPEEFHRIITDFMAGNGTRDPERFNSFLDPTLVSCSAEDQTLRISIRTQRRMENPRGGLHGGIAASLADYAMGVLTLGLCGGSIPSTVSLSLDYIRPVPPDAVLVMEAVCLKAGKTIVHLTASGWLENAPDQAVIAASGTYYIP